MFDFPVKESTIGTSLYCLIFYLAIIVSNYKYGLKYPFTHKVSESRQRWTIFLIGFFIVTHCLQGDFYSMMDYVHNYSSIAGAWNFGEEVYHKIGLGVGKNYFLFRTIVWGGSFFLFCMTAKRMNVSVYFASILLLATHVIIFSYARATSAMAIYFFGLSFLCRPLKPKLFSYIIGALIIYFSMEFHRSALIMAIMSVMILVPIKRWSIVLLLFLLPAMSILFSDILAGIAADGTNEVLAQKMEYYSEQEMRHGISGLLIMFLEYMSFYVPFILTAICVFSKGGIKKVPIEHLRMYKVAFGLIVVSLMFLFLGSSYTVYTYRVLFMSMIPLTILIVKLYQCNLMSRKYFSWCVLSGICYISVKYIYTIYCHLV